MLRVRKFYRGRYVASMDVKTPGEIYVEKRREHPFFNSSFKLREKRKKRK